MADHSEPFDSESYEWVELKSKNGVPFRVGRPKAEQPVESTNDPQAEEVTGTETESQTAASETGSQPMAPECHFDRIQLRQITGLQ